MAVDLAPTDQNPNPDQPIVVPSRAGTSPIGTTSPNTGSTAATNSTYAQGAFASGVNTQASNSYTIQNTDYQGIIIFNTASAIAVSLNSAVEANFTCTILNLSTGIITLTPTTGTVNGGASLVLGAGQGVQVFFPRPNWLAYAGTTVVQIVPQTKALVAHQFFVSYDATTGLFVSAQPAYSDISGTPTLAATAGPTSHQWLASYNATTGVFTITQPAFSDISGQVTTAQGPAAGYSGSVALAKLTTLGANGSLTVVNGFITAYTPPT
jgi:hypothetical protein